MSSFIEHPEYKPRTVVSTPVSTTGPVSRYALSLAEWFQGEFTARDRRSIAQLFSDTGAHAIVIADTQPMLYHPSNPEEPLFFHPGMAQHRIRQTKLGQPDRLLRVADVQLGDRIIDATLGLGADSLVLSAGVGTMGRVDAVESSWLLARLFEYACTQGVDKYSSMRDYLQSIHVHHTSHLSYLLMQPDNSADVVFFDPMFRHPTVKPSNIDSGRNFVNPAALSDLAFQEAKRVARRVVVLKERPYSSEFERFGLIPDKTRTPFAYGVWRKGKE